MQLQTTEVDGHLRDLRGLVYDLLMPESSGSDVTAVQNLGVSLSRSIRKDGVNVVQVQNVDYKVNSVAVHLLKKIDELQHMPLQACQVIDVVEEKVRDEADPHEKLSISLKALAEEGHKLNTIIDEVKKGYLSAVIVLHRGQSQTFMAKSLGVSQPFLSNMLSQYSLKPLLKT